MLKKSTLPTFGRSRVGRTQGTAAETARQLNGQYLIPTKIHLLNPDTTDKIFNTYEPDLMGRTVFDSEIVRGKAEWVHVDPEDKPTTL